MTDHLKEPRTVDRGMEHPDPAGRAKTDAGGFDLGMWPAATGSSEPNGTTGSRGNNQDPDWEPIEK